MRSTKTTKAADGQPCTLRVAGVCRGHTDTVVFCHAPSAFKGLAIKSELSDEADWGAFGCWDCHSSIGEGSDMAEIDRLHYWLHGIFRTQRQLFQNGVWHVR